MPSLSLCVFSPQSAHLCLIFFPFLSSLPPPLFSFLFHSSFCPSIAPFLTISPDPTLILILLPHSSITHFSHFCIHAQERGAPVLLHNPPPNPPIPKLSPSICPNIDPPPPPKKKPLPYYLLLYMVSFSIRRAGV